MTILQGDRQRSLVAYDACHLPRHVPDLTSRTSMIENSLNRLTLSGATTRQLRARHGRGRAGWDTCQRGRRPSRLRARAVDEGRRWRLEDCAADLRAGALDGPAATAAVAPPGDYDRSPRGDVAMGAPAAAARTPVAGRCSSIAQSSNSTRVRLRTTQRGQCCGRRIGDRGASVRPQRGQRTASRSLMAGSPGDERTKLGDY